MSPEDELLENSRGFVIRDNLKPKEKKNRQKFGKRFEADILVFNGLIDLLDDGIKFIERHVDQDSLRKEYSYLFINQNYSMLSNALSLLANGYELESLILIRPIAERIFLNLYFYEFEGDIFIYHQGYKKFYSHLRSRGKASGKNYGNFLEGVLNRLMHESENFKQGSTNEWGKKLYMSLVDEPSRLLHMDFNWGIAASMRGSKIIREPHFRVKGAKIVMQKLNEAALWTLLALSHTHDVNFAYSADLRIAHAIKHVYGIDEILKDVQIDW